MSFYYHFPQHPRHRGPIKRHHLWRLFEEKIRFTVLLIAVVGACTMMFWNSHMGVNLRYMMNSGNRNVKLLRFQPVKYNIDRDKKPE